MSNIKTYIIDYDWKAQMTVEIDHDIMTEAGLREINQFWSDDHRREQKFGLLNGVLVMLAQLVIPEAQVQGYSLAGVVGMFNWGSGNGQEGWPPMDGSEGIKITAIDISGLFDSDDITIKAA